MSYIVFDTETTGLPANKLNWRNDYMQFPHIVQLAWKTDTMKEVESHIIKPEGWTIPIESEKIHGISTERAMNVGKDMYYTLGLFNMIAMAREMLIGHNVHFDTAMIAANILRISVIHDKLDSLQLSVLIRSLEDSLSKTRRTCTMLKTIKFCNIKQPGTNRVKFPTLIELYYKLFGKTFPAHDAGEDVKATERCYLRLIELGIIN